MNGIGIYKVLNCNDENVCFDVKITKGENPNENILF